MHRDYRLSPLTQPMFPWTDMYPNEVPRNNSSVLLDPHRSLGMKPLESAVPNMGVVNDEELGQDWLQTEEDLQRHERPKRAVRSECPL